MRGTLGVPDIAIPQEQLANTKIPCRKSKRQSWRGLPIAIILTVYEQFFRYLNFANHKTKESFVLIANESLVGTLMTIGDVTVSIAIVSTQFTLKTLIDPSFKYRVLTTGLYSTP